MRDRRPTAADGQPPPGAAADALNPGCEVVGLTPPAPPTQPSFRLICFNTPYLDYLLRQAREVVERYDVDGIFYDIVLLQPCHCHRCMGEMIRRGMDPHRPADALALAREMQERYLTLATAAARSRDKRLRVCHNGGHLTRGDRAYVRHHSHLELESLPTAAWGYDHFPISARYVSSLGIEFLGMTGKFHTAWGEFGGYKHDNALLYECAAMIAQGARCSIGDQLHPRGAMDADTYRKMGIAYAHVKECEPWVRGADPVSEVAIVSVEAVRGARRSLDAHAADRSTRADTGAARVLLERQVMFDVRDTAADLDRYSLLVLPDEVTLDEPLAARLQAYVDRGGKLLLTGASGVDPEQKRFALLDVGTVRGRSEYEADYLKPTGPLVVLDQQQGAAPRLARAPLFALGGGWHVEPAVGATVMADLWRPYFRRDIRHFCSHQHAPADAPTGFPAAFVAGNVGYVAHDLFGQYADRGQPMYRDLLYYMIEALLGRRPNPVVGLPSGGGPRSPINPPTGGTCCTCSTPPPSAAPTTRCRVGTSTSLRRLKTSCRCTTSLAPFAPTAQ